MKRPDDHPDRSGRRGEDAAGVDPGDLQGIRIQSPVGLLDVLGTDETVTAVDFVRKGDRGRRGSPSKATSHAVAEAARQLDAYFLGKLRRFDLPLDSGGTPFQRAVWVALQDIPYGETTSYGELARRIGQPRAVRAVGAANGQNPIAIVIPCHRVVGHDGRLTGYGGGLETKASLLALERRVSAPLPLFPDGD